jgi:DNA mismatch endonuclease (patch repair protein)
VSGVPTLASDTVTVSERSRIMAAVKSKDTSPELVVRRLVHSLGYRYRLHVASLPGTPDLVFPSRKKIIFVHGCFWHGHSCADGHRPKSNATYWGPKIAKNIERDRVNRERLSSFGWSVVTVYECELASSTESILHQLCLRRHVESAASKQLRAHD